MKKSKTPRRSRLLPAIVLLTVVVAIAAAAVYFATNAPASVETQIENATSFIDSGKPTPAVSILRGVVQQNQNNAEARFQLGRAYLHLERYEFAEKELLRALEFDVPRSRIEPLLLRSMLERAGTDEIVLRTAVDEKLFESYPDDVHAEILAITGRAYVREGKPEQAQDFFARAAELAPDNPTQLLGRAMLAGLDGEDEQYRAMLVELTKTRPDFQDAWIYLGDLNVFEEKFDDAEENFTTALALRELSPVRLKRADARLRNRDLEGAREDYALLKKRQYRHPGVRLGLSRLDFLNGDVTASYDTAQSVINDFPNYVDASYQAGLASYSLGRYEQAEHYIGTFFSQRPASKTAARVLTAIALRRGNIQLARDTIDEALKYDPADPLLRETAMSVDLADGNYDDLITELESRIQTDPGASDFVIDLAMVHAIKGDEAQALTSLEAAFAADPTSTRSAQLLVGMLLKNQHSVRALDVAVSHRNALPDSARSHALLGTVLEELGRNDEAREAYQRAVDLDPGQVDARFALAKYASGSSDNSGAQNHFKAILKENPGRLEPLLALAVFAEKDGDDARAISYLEKAVEANPQSTHAALALALRLRNSKKTDQALAVLEAAAKRMPDNSLIINELAGNYMKEGRNNAALDLLTDEAFKNPDVADTHVLLARSALQVGELDTAKSAVDKALAINRSDRFANILAGKISLRRGNLDDAKKHLNLAQAAEPLPKPDVLGLKGDIAFAERRFADAAQAYGQAGEKDPNNSLWVYRQAHSEFEAGNGATAEGLLNQWIDQYPDDISAIRQLAEIQATLGKTDASIANYRRALELDENDLVVLNNLAWALRQTDPERAKKYAERALSANRNHLGIMDTYAVVLHHLGKSDDALGQIEAVLEKTGDIPLLNYHYAMILGRGWSIR